MLPFIGLDPTDQKRAAPPDAPQPAAKRQLLRSAYEQIVSDAIFAFGPILYVCSSGDPKVFEFEFWGVNRLGREGWVKLRFVLQFNALTRPSEPRNYLLNFRVFDKHGLVPNITALFANGTPPLVSLPCGGNAEDVKEKIREKMEGWLDFAQMYNLS